MPLLGFEVSALEFIFALKSEENSKVSLNEFLSILKLVYDENEIDAKIIEEITTLASSSGYELNETKFVALIEMVYLKLNMDSRISIPLYHILEHLRLQYLEEPVDYIQAGKVQEQVQNLLESESSRRKETLMTKHRKAMTSLKFAHDKQFIDFREEWKQFFVNFDRKVYDAMDAMKEKHSVSLDNYLQQLEFEAQSKTPLWSKELKQLRKREKILACQENYIEAQKVKDNVDLLEVEERKKALADNRDGSIARRETSFRRRQQAEVDVLQKKIDVQGETSKKRFESDCRRLLQRNRNIQESFKSKQLIELDKAIDSISKHIQSEINRGRR